MKINHRIKGHCALLAGVLLQSIPCSAADKPGAPALLTPWLSFWQDKVRLDGEAMYRWESRNNNFDFAPGSAANGTDDSWTLQRLRLGITLKPAPWLKVVVQGQDSREFGSDRADVPGLAAAEGDDTFDLTQAYLELGDGKASPWMLKIGRQSLAFGDERLVGPLEWLNFARRFDAVKLGYSAGNLKLTAFVSSSVVTRREGINRSDVFDGNDTSRGQMFAGLYASHDAPKFGAVDGYVFTLNQSQTNAGNLEAGVLTGNGAAGSDFVTIGTRLKGDPKRLGGWDVELETAAQFGRAGGDELRAFAFHGGAGYNLEAPLKPRLFAEYNYATGDGQPGDGKSGTFQNLFPTNHKFYGYMDLFAWQNIHNPQVSLRVSPSSTVNVQLDYHAFWLADTADLWYRANGVTGVRAKSPAADSFAGQEVDLTATWKAHKHVSVQAGISHFFAGSYLKNAPTAGRPHEDADFGYLMTTITF
jgi:hypothetical protein